MAQVVSFINLKGGVGKTTTTVNIAATIASRGKRVLLVDLDPQTNATVCVISQEEWRKRHDAKQTLYHLFDDMLNGTNNFSITQAIVNDVGEIRGLDLLPSSLHLVDIQDNIPDMDNKAYISHVDVIGNAISSIAPNYDFILIDCPPNLGAITLNGISISQYYIVPTVPDILSKIGISLIRNRIDSFKKRKKSCQIELGGILFTKVDSRTNLHCSTMQELRAGELSRFVFQAEFPQRISVAEAPIDSRPFITSGTAKKKSDFLDTQEIITRMTNEFMSRIGGMAS